MKTASLALAKEAVISWGRCSCGPGCSNYAWQVSLALASHLQDRKTHPSLEVWFGQNLRAPQPYRTRRQVSTPIRLPHVVDAHNLWSHV